MASTEKISSSLKLLDSKKNSIRKAILRVALEWKDLDDQLDSIDDSIEGSISELECKQKNLDSVRESTIQSTRELDSIRKSIESRAEELETKEKEFRSFQERYIGDLKLKEKQLVEVRRLVDERIEEAELREERLNELRELMEGLLERLEAEKKQLEPIQKWIGERLQGIGSKEKYFEGREKEINLIQNWIERRAKELDEKEERVDERVELMRKSNEESLKELESMRKSNEEKEIEIDYAQHLNEQRAEKLDSKEKQQNSVEKYINQSFKDFHAKNKQLKLDQELFEERRKELETKEKQLLELSKKLETKEKQLEGLCKKLETKEKQLEGLSKELDLKRGQLGCVNSHVNVEKEEDMPNVVSKSLSGDIQIVVTMDGRNLQFLVNERSNDHESMSSEVYSALQLSSDPAKLILDAMEGFYPPHLKKGDVEFEADVIRRSCILLLEQVMRMSPQIQPRVREEALKLAGEWKWKMGAAPSNYLEVLGFIQLLASYKLASSFDTDELWKLFVVVAEHEQAPELCRVLGFAEKVPDLIKNFVKDNNVLVAVKFIFAFMLGDKFPPVPLLKHYLSRSKKFAILARKRNMAEKSSEAQDRVIDERIASVRAVIKCVIDHNLESEISLQSLEQRIEQLLIQKEGNKKHKPACLVKSKAHQYDNHRVISSTTAPVHPKASASMLHHTTPTMACILANMDGKNMQLFLNEHLEENEWMHKDVYNALQMSSDSGELVLDAMQGFYPPHSKKGGIDIEASVIRKSCTFLLGMLRRLSPQIKPQVKAAAMKLAVDWKAKTVVDTKNPLAILGFLQLVDTYGLASAFDTDDLLNLFQAVAKRRYAPLLSQPLGFSEKIPVNNILHFQEKIEQSASENLQLNGIVPSSSVRPWNPLWGEVPACIQFASDPAKLVLDAMQGCYHSNLQRAKQLEVNVLKSFSLLLSQLLRVPLEVTTHVKEGAMKFASDWKDKVKRRNDSEVWCFLLFLATYKLASSFNTNELLGLLDMVYTRKQAIDLFRSLGLADEVPNFIERLIERGLHLGAIRYINAFDLVLKIPPPSLLKGYLSHAKEAAENIRKEGRNSQQAQDKAINKEVAALYKVIKCITLHGLESQYPPANLKARVEELQRLQRQQRALRRSAAPPPAAKAQPPEEVNKRSAMQSSTPKDVKKRFAPDHDSDTRPQQNPAKKPFRKAISPLAVSNNPVSTTRPLQSIRQSFQQEFAAETVPHLRTQPGHYSLSGASPPVPPMHMSQHGSGTPASRGFPPFGSAPSFNASPFIKW